MGFSGKLGKASVQLDRQAPQVHVTDKQEVGPSALPGMAGAGPAVELQQRAGRPLSGAQRPRVGWALPSGLVAQCCRHEEPVI